MYITQLPTVDVQHHAMYITQLSTVDVQHHAVYITQLPTVDVHYTAYNKVLKSSLLLVITARRCLVTEYYLLFMSLSKPWNSLVTGCK
jgi:hypothetical protein